MKNINKNVRTRKKGLGYKNLDSSAISNSNSDIVTSSVGDVGQEKVLSTTNANYGNEKCTE